MKTTIILAASVFALAACGGEGETGATTAAPAATEDETMLAGEAPGFEAVAPGTYEVSVEGEDGVDLLTIHPGLTWSMVFADGEAAGGTIYQQAGETCFITEGEEEPACFTTTETAPDGSMTNASSDGTMMTVRPVEIADGDAEI